MATYTHGYAKQDEQWWFWFPDGRRVRAREVECKQCGRLFPTYREQEFCSVGCRGEARKKVVPPKKCPWCRESFTPGEKEQVFCSHSCAAESMHAKKIAPVKKRSGSTSELIPKEKAHRFTQDSEGQWWYHFGVKNPCRTRAFPKDCPRCGRRFIPTPIRRGTKGGQVHCSRECGVRASYENPEVRAQFHGPNSHLWKGGRLVTNKGYVKIWCPGHPSVKYGARRHVFEHRLVMEQILGRFLMPYEQVHHKNGIRDDNRPENLELWVHQQPAGQRVHEQKHCPTCTCNQVKQ